MNEMAETNFDNLITPESGYHFFKPKVGIGSFLNKNPAWTNCLPHVYPCMIKTKQPAEKERVVKIFVIPLDRIVCPAKKCGCVLFSDYPPFDSAICFFYPAFYPGK